MWVVTLCLHTALAPDSQPRLDGHDEGRSAITRCSARLALYTRVLFDQCLINALSNLEEPHGVEEIEPNIRKGVPSDDEDRNRTIFECFGRVSPKVVRGRVPEHNSHDPLRNFSI